MEKLTKIILPILLLLCLLDMPYGFYQFVRFAAMVGFGYLAYSAKERNRKNEMFIYIAFQPFMKIALGRTIWNIVDVITAIGLLVSALTDDKKLKTK
jgi:multisubunit Na+/H+ antiporter MnhB subunit